MALPPEFYSTARLAQIHEVARARQIAPDYLLAVAMSRAVCRVTPRWALPPIVGAAASLNVHFGIVGPSGLGKGIAMAAGVEAFPLVRDQPDPIVTENLGSGERLASVFMRKVSSHPVAMQYREAALILSPEIDQFQALIRRDAATLEPVMRSSWSGEGFGFGYRDDTKRLPVAAHHARLCWIVGIQPGRADSLYGRRATDGGTAQRVVLFDGIDVGAPWPPPPMPPMPLPWAPPSHMSVIDEIPNPEEFFANDEITSPFAWHGEPFHLKVDASIWDELGQARHARLTGAATGDPLDAHRGLNRLKLAAALMLIEAMPAIDGDVWFLAGMVMDASDELRGRLLAELPKADQDHAARLGELDAIRRDAAEESRYAGTMQYALRHIREHRQQGGCRIGCLQAGTSLRRRPHLIPALGQLVAAGQLATEVRTVKQRGDEEHRYWWLP